MLAMMYLIDAPYYYAGQLRWNLYWTSPTLAAVFLSTLIPLCWLDDVPSAFAKFRIVKVVAISIEGGAWFALTKTYSRGAMLAVILAYAYYSFVGGVQLCQSSNWRRWCLMSCGRLFVVAAMVWFTGLAPRLRPAFIAGDNSVLHRLSIWKGALEMISASPFTGWGAGLSGIAYTDWFQPSGQHEAVRTMVNSYLTLAVERGLLIATVAFFVIFSGILLPLSPRLRDHESQASIHRLTASALVGFGLSSSFVSVEEAPSLLVIPLFLVLLSAFVAIIRTGVRVTLVGSGYSIIGSIVVAFGCWLCGHFLADKNPITVRPRDCGWVILSGKTSARDWSVPWALFPSEEVLGKDFGRVLREFVHNMPSDFWAFATRGGSIVKADEGEPTTNRRVYFGETFPIRWVWGLDGACIFFHPIGLPPSGQWPLRTVVVLPAFDPAGRRDLWTSWASKRGFRIVSSASIGYYCGLSSLQPLLSH